MSDPDKQKEVVIALWLNFKPRAVLAVAQSEEMGESVKAMAFRVGDLIDKGNDVAELELNVSALEQKRKDAEEDLQRLEDLQADLADFTKSHPDFVAYFDDFADISKDLAEARRKATTRPIALKKMADLGHARIKVAANSQQEILSAWAHVDALLEDQQSLIDTEHEGLKAQLEGAQKLAEDHDAHGLKALQTAASNNEAISAAFVEWFRMTNADFEKRLAKHGPLKGSLAKTLADERAKTGKVVAKVAATAAANHKLIQQIEAVKVKAIDFRKAAQVLELPAKLLGKLLPQLEHALGMDPASMIKALDKLLKDAGLSASGKDAVAKLHKAKVI